MLNILAQVVPVWLIWLSNTQRLDQSNIDEIKLLTISAYFQAGVIVDFQKTIEFPFSESPETQSVYSFHRKLYRVARKNKWLRRGRIVHFLTDASADGYMTGVANRICYKSNRLSFAWSYATAQNANINGSPRLLHSALGLIHELGHGMNAQHVASRTVMNTNVLHLFNQFGPLTWDQRSVNQINNCVNWKQKKQLTSKIPQKEVYKIN